MMFWACSAVSVGGGLLAIFAGDIPRAVLSLWIAGLGVGGLYLSMGAELLAVAQWVVSTIVAISFIFYAVMFGEYKAESSRITSRQFISYVGACALGAAFVSVIWLGSRDLRAGGSLVEVVAPVTELSKVGKTLVEEHLLSLEILALTLFVVLIGSGVIARAEAGDT